MTSWTSDRAIGRLSNTTRYGYDALGNRAVMTDANGVVTCYGYDKLSRLITVTESFTVTAGLDPMCITCHTL